MNVEQLQRWQSEQRSTTNYSGDITGLTLTDPSLLTILGAGPTSAGVTVNRQNALRLSTVAACVNVLAQSLSVLPVEVRQRTGDRQTRSVPEHPLWRLLNLEPNPWMTSLDALAVAEWWRQVDGAGYMFVDFDGQGRPVEMYPLESRSTTMIRPGGGRPPVYQTVIDGVSFRFLPGEIVHIKGHTYDGLEGQSPIGFLRETIGTGIAARERASRTFANGGISGVIESEGKFSSPEARDEFLNHWRKAYGQLSQTGRVALLPSGMSFKSAGMTGTDAQLLEQAKHIRTEICGYYRVPPHMVGDMDRSTFSNIEEQDLFFVKHTMHRLVRSWEQELMRKLLTQTELAAGFYIRFQLDELLRGDIATRFEAYQKGITAGFMSRNEAREAEHWNVTDSALDNYLRPLNMDPEGQQQQPSAQRALMTEGEARSAQCSANPDAVQPVVRELVEVLERREARAGENRTEWWDAKHAAIAERQALPVFQTVARVCRAPEVSADDAVRRFLSARREAFTKGHELPELTARTVAELLTQETET
ncbi:MAG: phage portal protein [Pseudomonadota bacterium]